MNPEAPGRTSRACARSARTPDTSCASASTIYPEYLSDDDFLDLGVRPRVRALADEHGLARDVSPEPLVEAFSSATFCRTVTGTPTGVTRAPVAEAAGLDDAAVARALEAGLLPVETARAEAPAIARVVDPPVAMELLGRGVPGWRISVRHAGARADALDALVRTGAAFLRTDADALEEAIELGWLPGISMRVSVAVHSLAEALDAIAAGAVTWLSATGARRRSAPGARRSPRAR